VEAPAKQGAEVTLRKILPISINFLKGCPPAIADAGVGGRALAA